MESILNMPYMLESTGDHTDRSREIEKILCEKGACLLGVGVFYVSGVTMPEHTTLMGLGTATRIVLDPAIEEGFAVSIGSFCTVKDLSLYGAEEEIPTPDQVGGRHGIIFRGTATMQNWQESGPRSALVSGCLIRHFSGGGLTCVDSGMMAHNAMSVTNCHILHCGAGINIAHFSEYHEFTNVHCFHNLYGCINNGGNNMFLNCGFDDNVTGFLIDNRAKQSPNNSHGSAVGCTFNHSDNNNGIGIQVLGAAHGYVFSGCQIFFSKIVLENASGIIFNSINLGRKTDIFVTGGDITLFTGCVFQLKVPITVTDNGNVKFINCYTRDGETVDLEA